jgi:magnesium-transporting ATPase (P-type)
MASITTMLPDQCTVLRDGTSQSVAGSQIFPGDVLFLKMGDKVTADVRFVEVSTDAKFDRSILTGMLEASFTNGGSGSDGNAQASRYHCTARWIRQTTITSRQRALEWLELMSPRATP